MVLFEKISLTVNSSSYFLQLTHNSAPFVHLVHLCPPCPPLSTLIAKITLKVSTSYYFRQVTPNSAAIVHFFHLVHHVLLVNFLGEDHSDSHLLLLSPTNERQHIRYCPPCPTLSTFSVNITLTVTTSCYFRQVTVPSSCYLHQGNTQISRYCPPCPPCPPSLRRPL